MAKKYSLVPARIASLPSKRDGDGNPIHNELLRDLLPKESDKFLPKLEFVRLKLHQVLHEAGETLKSGYFCNSGMFSVLTVTPDGRNVEVGLPESCNNGEKQAIENALRALRVLTRESMNKI